MNATATKSPNQQRLDHIDRMLKEITRETDKALDERTALIAERDQLKARLEAAERERDEIKSRLEHKTREQCDLFKRWRDADAKLRGVSEALGWRPDAMGTHFTPAAEQPAPIAEPECAEVADKLAGLSGAEAEAKLREITGDRLKPRRRSARQPYANEELIGLSRNLEPNAEIARLREIAAEFDQAIMAFWQGDKKPLSEAQLARLREIATTGQQLDALANVLEATEQLDEPEPEPEPAPAGLGDLAAAIERVTGKSASFAVKPAPKVIAIPAEPAPAEGNANDAAIIRALGNAATSRPGALIKVAELHPLAEAYGYTNTEAALRWRLAKGPNPLAAQRADIIETQASPLAWRLRDPKPDGGDKIDQPDAPVHNVADHVSAIIEGAPGDGWTSLTEVASAIFKREGWRPDIHEVAKELDRLNAAGKIELHTQAHGRRNAVKWKAPAEPAPDAKSELVKLYGRLAPADRIKRDRLLLEALGDEGKTFGEWRAEIEARGGDLGCNAQLTLEAAQQRLKETYIHRNHFGGGAKFWAYPSLKEALAKLEAGK